MTLITKQFTGHELLQEDLENINFIVDGNVVKFNPPVLDGETLHYTCFSNTHHPTESENVTWVSTRLKWERLASQEVSDFLAIVSLSGLQLNGQEELIGEKIINTCPTTETVEDIVFDLKSSRGEPPVKNLVGNAPVDKIQLNLPYRRENIESVVLHRNWLSGWGKRVKVSITCVDSDIVGNVTNLPFYISITYDSDMKADFSDIRFVAEDGATILCQYRVSYTPSTNAGFFVLLPIAPSYGVVKNFYILYGNSSASLISNPFNVFPLLYENWEDGKYTGRSSPYKNWTLSAGTVTFDTATPIEGTTTLKHAGNGENIVNNRLQRLINELDKTYRVNFKFKQTAMGSGTYTPFHHLWFVRFNDANNYIVVLTYYNGTNQILRLRKVENGAMSDLKDWIWVSDGKLSDGTTYTIEVRVTPTRILVYINGTLRINSLYTFNPSGGAVGFGSNINSAAEWDDIFIRPYGAWSNTLGLEEVTQEINPDNGLDEDTSVLFSVPADWSALSSSYFRVKEYLSTEYDTEDVKLSNRSIVELGFDNVDRYIALRQKIELWSTSLCNVSFNQAEYVYEV